MEKFKLKIERYSFIIGIVLLFCASIAFLYINNALFAFPILMWIIFLLIPIVMLLSYFILSKKKTLNKFFYKTLSPLALLVSFIGLIFIILFGCTIHFFQPLMLSSLTCILFFSAIVFVLFSGVSGYIFKSRHFITFIAGIGLTVFFSTGALWAFTADFQNYYNVKDKPLYIFENGENGYSTFRIPSVITLDKNVLNSLYGFDFENDLLLCSAEARKNSSFDTGDIDIVAKISCDKGKSWSDLIVLFSFGEELGKYGNPTPVFDKVNGILNFVYLTASKKSGYDYRTYNTRLRLNSDLSFGYLNTVLLNTEFTDNVTLGAPDGINENSVVPGPGKGIQLPIGRIIIPCNYQGKSYAYISDDFGMSFKRGQDAGFGNECEVALLKNGQLIMVVRDNINCSDLHNEQFLRFSYSNDAGESWYIKTENSALKTPVCMSSVAVKSSGEFLVSHPDNYFTRSDLSVSVSKDNGNIFETKKIYEGPSGYSSLAVDNMDNVYLLAEVGRINYNEAIVFLKLDI